MPLKNQLTVAIILAAFLFFMNGIIEIKNLVLFKTGGILNMPLLMPGSQLDMRVSILIPCYNEEKSIEKCIMSCLSQTRQADEIIIVDDASSDATPEILRRYADKIKVVRTPQNTGNKSYAQEFGLQFVTGDVFISTDADTILAANFIEKITAEFNDEKVVAVGGYVKSLKYNWLTRGRALDYAIGQNLFKLAQSCINFMFVIPGAAGAFRTKVFKNYITFDHDTITEDLDFTYKLHANGLKIKYNREAIAYTQDPANLKSYVNQMRRWYGGGWQNLIKHWEIAKHTAGALILSLMYIEGLIFSFLLFLIPLINVSFALNSFGLYFVVIFGFSLYAAVKEKRADLLWAFLPYLLLIYINAWVFLEQFFKEVVLKRKNLVWFKPDRVKI